MRSDFQGTKMKKLDINKILTESSHLPTMPAVAKQLLSISEWDDVDLGVVAEIISKDISLSSKILRIVNSPFYGFASEISTISQALVILGLRATRSLTLSFSLLRSFPRDGAGEFDYPGFWTRSLNTAVAARELAVVAGLQTVEEAFLAGLLQDIGVMLIARCAPKRYDFIVSEAEDKLAPSIELERKYLGTDHVEVNKLLFDEWGLPASLCIPILYHHEPAKAASSNDQTDQTALAVRIQHFAGLVGQWLYVSSGEDMLLENLKKLASEYFGLTPKQLEAIMYKVDSVVEQMLEFFDLTTPRPNSYANLLEKANLTLGEIVSEQEHLLRELEAARAEAQKLSEQLRLANNKLLDEARSDALTGLPNRRQFEEFLQKEIERTARYNHPIALLFIDIDDFKSLNDRYGHLEGDSVLKQLAEILRQNVRRSDMMARWGGEEFIAALVETDGAGAQKVAERIRRSIENARIHLDNGVMSLNLTASVGVAVCESPGKLITVNTLIRKADQAMYEAKHLGKNRVYASIEKDEVPHFNIPTVG